MNKLTKIINCHEVLKKTHHTLTGVDQALLHEAGDYDLIVFSIPPGHKQRMHYHSYGLIDIFTVLEGSGILHLAKVEDGKVVPGSEEKHSLTAGDTYPVGPYTLHGIENTGEGLIKVTNIAQPGHSMYEGIDYSHISTDIMFIKGHEG